MSLPPSYNNSEEYLEDLLSFLKRYEWIYNYPNTDILINKIFDNFPPHWDNYFRVLNNDDMNLLSNGIAKVFNLIVKRKCNCFIICNFLEFARRFANIF